MKSSRFRELSEDELLREERELTEALFKLRFQLAIGQIENPQKIRITRRDLARVKTRLRELEIEAAGGPEQSTVAGKGG
jgi:large subunit ribosomal protein L29